MRVAVTFAVLDVGSVELVEFVQNFLDVLIFEAGSVLDGEAYRVEQRRWILRESMCDLSEIVNMASVQHLRKATRTAKGSR